MDARYLRVALGVAFLFVFAGARHASTNFIIETPDAKFARQVSETSEKLRHELAVLWLGEPMPDWSQPCMMTVKVGPNLGAGGATSFMFDRGEVFGWRMNIQGPEDRILDSVLPHEITHMVFASHFRRPLPRWADEGGATTTEDASERNKHRRMLVQFLQTGRGIAFNRMFAMKEYPSDIMPLYAQGHSLADFLIQKAGRKTYLEFVEEGMNTEQWSQAVRNHYQVNSLGELQNTWLAWVKQGSPAIDATAPRPIQEQSPSIQLAGNRRPRPEPNLVLRVPKSKQATDTSDAPPIARGPAEENLTAEVETSTAASGGVVPEPPVLPADDTSLAGGQAKGQVILQWVRD